MEQGEWVGEDLLRAYGDEMMRINSRRATPYVGTVLDSSAFKILWLLVEGGPRTLRDLAEALQLEQSTINRQVNAALKHGLLERFSVEGRASRLLRPTAAGEQAYLHDGRLRAAALTEALGELGRERATGLVEDLRALNDALDRVHARVRAQDEGAATADPIEPGRAGSASRHLGRGRRARR